MVEMIMWKRKKEGINKWDDELKEWKVPTSWIRFEALERMTKSDALMMRVSKENRTQGVSLSCKRTARCSCQCHSHFCCFERERRNLFSSLATDQNFRRLPVPSPLRCYYFPTFGCSLRAHCPLRLFICGPQFID